MRLRLSFVSRYPSAKVSGIIFIARSTQILKRGSICSWDMLLVVPVRPMRTGPIPYVWPCKITWVSINQQIDILCHRVIFISGLWLYCAMVDIFLLDLLSILEHSERGII